MLDNKKIAKIMSVILKLGMILAMGFVMLGGILYLLQHGNEKMQYDIMEVDFYKTNIALIWDAALSYSPLGMIELGLLILVITQGIRVGLLTWFYAVIRDYKFFFMSLFILIVMTYSLFFRYL